MSDVVLEALARMRASAVAASGMNPCAEQPLEHNEAKSPEADSTEEAADAVKAQADAVASDAAMPPVSPEAPIPPTTSATSSEVSELVGEVRSLAEAVRDLVSKRSATSTVMPPPTPEEETAAEEADLAIMARRLAKASIQEEQERAAKAAAEAERLASEEKVASRAAAIAAAAKGQPIPHASTATDTPPPAPADDTGETTGASTTVLPMRMPTTLRELVDLIDARHDEALKPVKTDVAAIKGRLDGIEAWAKGPRMKRYQAPQGE